MIICLTKGTVLATNTKAFIGLNVVTELAKQSDVDNCFQSVSEGKSLIASAITDKGVSTSSTATFQTMANNIANILSIDRLVSSASADLWSDDGRNSDIVLNWINPPPALYCWRHYSGKYQRFEYYDPTGSYAYGVSTNSTYYFKIRAKYTIIPAFQLWLTDYNFMNGTAKLVSRDDALSIDISSIAAIDGGVEFYGTISSVGWEYSDVTYYFIESSTSFSLMSRPCTFRLLGYAYINVSSVKTDVRSPISTLSLSV